MSADVTVVVEPPAVFALDVGAMQGPPGPPGPPGAAGATTLVGTAAATISGQRAIVSTPAGLAHANIGDPAQQDAVLGLSTHAAIAGASCTVQASGEMADSAWSWTPGAPLYVGAGGLLTHTAPVFGWLHMIAVAITPTRILIAPRSSVALI